MAIRGGLGFYLKEERDGERHEGEEGALFLCRERGAGKKQEARF